MNHSARINLCWFGGILSCFLNLSFENFDGVMATTLTSLSDRVFILMEMSLGDGSKGTADTSFDLGEGVLVQRFHPQGFFHSKPTLFNIQSAGQIPGVREQVEL